LQELEETWPEPALYPSDPVERDRSVELEDYFDEELGVYIRQWFYFLLLPYSSTIATLSVGHSDLFHRLLFRAIFPKVRPRMIRYMKICPAEAEAARKRTTSTMDRIERELQPSGYLVVDHFAVADLTAAALLWPLVMPREFPYKLPAKFHQRVDVDRAVLNQVQHEHADLLVFVGC
jgi:glutathione S-transferase